ncbi:MAG: sulfatase-like hydrolase/transferase [Acidobacteria bacterium]|nr:sulfatase-like hydrolase/transferase [Acidobacteriota bacterium]
MKSLWFGAARGCNTLYFVGSSLYCLLGYSSFANEQFIRPQLISWLPGLVTHHHELFWLALLLTLPTLMPTLRRGSSQARAAAAAYLVMNVGVGLWIVVNPVLATVGQDDGTLRLALLFLLPPLALACLDHATVPEPIVRRVDDRHVFLTFATAAVLVWVTYALLVPWYLPRMPGTNPGVTALGVATGVSLTSHLLLFAAMYLVAGASLWVVSFVRAPIVDYWVLCVLTAIGLALVLQRVVAATLSFGHPETWILCGGMSLVIIAVWSGLCWQQAARDTARGSTTRDLGHAEDDSIDIWFQPLTLGHRWVALAGIVAMPILAAGLRAAVERFDWNFLFQRLGVCALWVLAFAVATEISRRAATSLRLVGRRTGVLATMLVCIGLVGVPTVSRLSAWTGDSRLDPEFVLDRYSALDASYQLIRGLLEARASEHAEFYTFLKAHSTLGRVAVAPIDVSFVTGFDTTQRRPHVFLFIVDSLRPDYLSPYNAKVNFTPATQTFAAESVLFERAFTRYGSTGLSVPAMWAGGMLLHKQYVKPFAPMNALEKLLDGEGYRRYLSDDHLVTQLFRPSAATTLLDQEIQEMDHTICATTRELQSKLDETKGDPRPVFAMTRPLQLHTARLVRNPPIDASAYPGFEPNYAAQVVAFDRCFGEFVNYLKRTGLYDQSVVMLTSDHGESLGEDGRWGHGNALHPELLRVPLIVHLPTDARPRFTADRSRVAFSTDITPTLYQLAGQHPRDRGPLYGEPLFGTSEQPLSARSSEAFLMSASYGPGYALLRRNGELLYLADAVQGRDFAYAMAPDGTMVRQTVTDALRSVNRAIIRDQIGQIAAEYHFSPEN